LLEIKDADGRSLRPQGIIGSNPDPPADAPQRTT